MNSGGIDALEDKGRPPGGRSSRAAPGCPLLRPHPRTEDRPAPGAAPACWDAPLRVRAGSGARFVHPLLGGTFLLDKPEEREADLSRVLSGHRGGLTLFGAVLVVPTLLPPLPGTPARPRSGDFSHLVPTPLPVPPLLRPHPHPAPLCCFADAKSLAEMLIRWVPHSCFRSPPRRLDGLLRLGRFCKPPTPRALLAAGPPTSSPSPNSKNNRSFDTPVKGPPQGPRLHIDIPRVQLLIEDKEGIKQLGEWQELALCPSRSVSPGPQPTQDSPRPSRPCDTWTASAPGSASRCLTGSRPGSSGRSVA